MLIKQKLSFQKIEKKKNCFLAEAKVIHANGNESNNGEENIDNCNDISDDNMVKKTLCPIDGPKKIPQSQLVGIMLIFSIACSVSPALEMMALSLQNSVPFLSQYAQAKLDISPMPHSHCFGGLEGVDVALNPRGERLVEKTEGGVSGVWSALQSGGVLSRRQQQQDDDEADDDDDDDDGDNEGKIICNNKKMNDGDEINSFGESGQSGDIRNTLSGSSISGSAGTSPPSTPHNVTTTANVVFVKLRGECRGGSAFDTRTGCGKANAWGFEHLPESVLFVIISFFSFPDVIKTLRTNRRLNEAVKKYFAVNEHGAFSIPAFKGRLTPSYLHSSLIFGKKKVNNKNGGSDAVQSLVLPQKTIRLFFGQQRRDSHSLSLRHLLNFLVPDMFIPHIEAHTNVHKCRGKGCSWVFVTSQKDAERLMAFSKLIFLDINERREEVYILVPPRSREWLQKYAEAVGGRGGRPINLPRQPIVVEVPMRSSARVSRALWQHKSRRKTDTEQHSEQKTEQELKEEKKEKKKNVQSEEHCKEVKEEQEAEKRELKETIAASAVEIKTTTHVNDSVSKKKKCVCVQKEKKTFFPVKRLQTVKTLSTRKKQNCYLQPFFYSYERNKPEHYQQHLFLSTFSAKCFANFNFNETTVVIDNNLYRHDPYIHKPLSSPVWSDVY